MTLTIELTPGLEARLRERAAREGRDEADVAIQAVEHYLLSELLPAPAIGAQILAEWEQENILGIWQDRSEDTRQLAKEFRGQAEARGQST